MTVTEYIPPALRGGQTAFT